MIEEVEKNVRRAHEANERDTMTAEILKGYGSEIYGFLVATHGDYSEADEVFSSFGEALWTSLDRFEMRCAARTWAYRVARVASANRFREVGRRREQPMTLGSDLSALVQQVRTATASHLKTERKSQIQALRDELDPPDRSLLVLRVDRNLAWKELARVFLEEADLDPTGDALDREAARLRQRYQTLKRRLREMGRERGLID